MKPPVLMPEAFFGMSHRMYVLYGISPSTRNSGNEMYGSDVKGEPHVPLIMSCLA